RVGLDRDRAAIGQAVAFARPGRYVASIAALEPLAVAAKVAVEAHAPRPIGRESDRAVVLGLVQEVGDEHPVCAGTAAVPSPEPQQLSLLVDPQDPHVLSPEPSSDAPAIKAQRDQVPVKPDDPTELPAHVPVERDVVAEPASFQELLALEEHRNPRR